MSKKGEDLLVEAYKALNDPERCEELWGAIQLLELIHAKHGSDGVDRNVASVLRKLRDEQVLRSLDY